MQHAGGVRIGVKSTGVTLLGVAVLILAGPAAANRLIGLAQLAGGQGCIAQPDEDAEAVRGCGRGRGLIDPSSVALSPDGESVYVAGSGSSAVAAFARDRATGRLTQRNCVSANATSGVDGTKGACADGNALSGATDVEVSPDGRFVYAASFDAGGIAIFERSETTGALRQVGLRAAREDVHERTRPRRRVGNRLEPGRRERLRGRLRLERRRHVRARRDHGAAEAARLH